MIGGTLVPIIKMNNVRINTAHIVSYSATDKEAHKRFNYHTDYVLQIFMTNNKTLDFKFPSDSERSKVIDYLDTKMGGV